MTQASIRWHLNNEDKHGEDSFFQTVDLILSDILTTAGEPSTEEYQLRLIQGDDKLEIAKTKASVFLTSVVNDTLKQGSQGAVMKLVLPASDGYVVRSDYLEQRLYGCPNVQLVEGLVAPRQHLPKPEISSACLQSFSDILASAAGAIVLGDAKPKLASTALEDFSEVPRSAKKALSLSSPTAKTQESLLSELERELFGRFSLPWLISEPIPERTIAILGHRSLFMMERWIRGAHALGCKVLVFGQHGSFFEEPQYAGLIEQFVPIDMTVDQNLAQRILDALEKSDHKLDGITSTIDVYFDAAAKVSLELNLHTSPIESIAMAQDKYATRTRFGNSTPLMLLATDCDDLRKQIDALASCIIYPLIVKPSKGWSSEGVFKVTTESELFTSVSKLNTFQPGVKVIVETYVDGPEVDANFLLWDRDIHFFEVVDDFPCSADLPGSAFSTANFQELEMVYPSNLIASEQELLKTQIHKFLLDSGFRDGIFHVEARIQNSAMEYNTVDGVVDLRPKAHPPPPDAKPQVFILEVNVRCPGWMVIWATCYTHGVDYAATQMLAALGDGTRFKILSEPFSFGAQASVESIFVPSPRGGTIPSNIQPFCEELRDRRPDLLRARDAKVEAVRIQTMQFPGDDIPDPDSGILSFVASFNLATREVERTEMLRLGREIRKEVRIDIR